MHIRYIAAHVVTARPTDQGSQLCPHARHLGGKPLHITAVTIEPKIAQIQPEVRLVSTTFGRGSRGNTAFGKEAETFEIRLVRADVDPNRAKTNVFAGAAPEAAGRRQAHAIKSGRR